MKCRKLLAILLALVMVIGLLPFAALAAGDPPVPQAGGHHDGWTALDASTSSWKLGNGSYYLAENLNLGQQVTIQGDVTLCLNGCTLKALPYASGAVKVSAGASLTICDCGNGGKITSACSNTNPTLRVYGTCTLKSGAITVEDATASGGCAVRINDTGVFTMTGGSLVGGKYGVYNQNVANLNGGTVSGVTAGAANENNPGRLNVAGSAIESSDGEAISLAYGSLNMTSGSASGAAADIELATSKRNNSENIVLRIAGGSAGRIIHRSDYPLYLSGAPTVTSVELASVENQLFASENRIPYNGSAIAVSLQDPPEAGETVIQGISGNADRFTLQADGLYFEADDNGNLVATDQAPASGHTHGVNGTDTDPQTWQVWNPRETPTISQSGYYYLGEDFEFINQKITINTDVHLCLNGHKLQSNIADLIEVTSSGSLTICDCSKEESGQLYFNSSSAGKYAVSSKGSVTLYSGTISSTGAGGVGMPYNSTGTFTMEGGTIDVGDTGVYCGGKTSSVVINDGTVRYGGIAGVLLAEQGSVTVKGGTIEPQQDNTTGYGLSANSYNSTVVISGGKLEGKYGASIQSTGEVYLVGEPEISGTSADLYIKNANVLCASKETASYVGKDLTLSFGGSADETEPIVLDVNAQNEGKFQLTKPEGKILVSDGNNLVLGDKTPDHQNHGANGTGTITETWQPWTQATDLSSITSGYYYLTANITHDGMVIIESGADVHICLNGQTMTQSVLYVGNNASVTICDCKDNGEIIGGSTGALMLNGGSTVNFYSGTISSEATDAVNITLVTAEAQATFNMYGGTINSKKMGISNNGGIVNVYGGTILFDDYAGVFNGNDRSVATIAGGTIQPQEDAARGDNGVYVSKGTLYLTGDAKISGLNGDIKINNPNAVYASKGDAAYSGKSLSIYFSGGATVTEPVILDVTNDNADLFELVWPYKKDLVRDSNNNLVLGTKPVGHQNHSATGEGELPEGATWVAWDGTTPFSEAFPANSDDTSDLYVYLTADVTYSNVSGFVDIAPNNNQPGATRNVHLCLNGHTISGVEDGVIKVKERTSLTICDCDEQARGTIQNTSTNYNYDVITASGDVTLYSGKLISNQEGINLTYSPAVTFRMKGGSIEAGDIAIRAGNHEGGVEIVDGEIRYGGARGIFISDGTVHVSGGTIAPKEDNSNESAAGIEFTWNTSGKLYLTGDPSITGKDAALSISKPNAVYASDGGNVYSGAPLTVAFTEDNDNVPIILNVTDGNAGKFTLVSPADKTLVRQGNNLVLSSEPAGHQAHDATGKGSIPEGKEWIAWDGSTQMNAPGYYYLDKDVTLTSTIEVTADVHLCLNGHEMSDNGGNARFIIVNRDASLTICDCSKGETGRINYNCNTDTGYAINNKGALTLYSGEIYSDGGNGILIMSDGGSNVKFDMEGGTIDVGRIGILFSIGKEVNIKDGTLTYGGQNGILFGAKGTLTVSGGTIQPRENGASESRGISRTDAGDLYVTDGNISGKQNGIRIINAGDGEVEISGGNISASGEKGYGIYLYETATANLYLSNDPTISGQKADLYIGKPNKVYAGKETAAYNGSALDIYYAGDAATEDPIILNVTEDNANSFNLNYPTNKTLEHRGDNLYLADEILPMPELTVTVDPNPLTYGQTAQATVSGEPSGASISYEIIESEPAGVASIGTDGAITTNGVGTFKVKVTVSATGYSDGEATSAEITVNKATPTPEAPTGLTATYGDTLEDIDLPTGWTWKNPETSVGNVGSHEFDAIYQETPEKYYNSVPMKLSVEVTPKSISGASIELGDSLRYTGEEQTQTVDSVTLDGVALDPKDYTLTNNKATDVGTYTLTITGTGNYNGTVTKQWSIAKAAPTVTDPTAKTDLVYTGAAQELVTAGTATGGTMVYSLSENGTYVEAIPEGTYAGDYTVWYKVKGDGNHSDTAPQSIEVSIGKAKLTVKANDLSINEGSPVPTYTASYSGFVNGETETDLSGKLTFTCSYTQNSQPSTYDIKPSGLTSDNYAITFQNGTLTVVAVGEILPPVAKDLTYTGKAQKLIDPAQAADDVDLFYSLDLQHFYRTIPEATNAGTYTVYWEAKKDGTTVDNGSLTVTIKKAPLTVTADDIWVYAGNTPKFTVTIKGYVNGEDGRVLKGDLTFICGYSQKYSKPGSSYTITPKGLTADNYDITFKTGTLTVKDPLSPRFNVYVLDSKHGTVEADCRYARKGDVVTLTIKPDWGYELETLTVTDSHGYELKLTYHSNGTYTFTMPRDNVTVKAIFTVRDMPFVDVPGDAWYAGGVRYVYAHGLMNGTGNWRFSPNRTTTRAMIATILYRMEGSPRVYGTSQFGDVEAGSWYEDAVIWATQNDIVEGYTSKTFGPNDPITREQMAAMLYRYADYCRCDMSAGRYVDLSKYSDMNEISDYAIPALRWAVGEEIIEGRTGKRLAPTDTATRAEVAVMLMRFCEDVIW